MSRTRILAIIALLAVVVALIATILWRDWLWSTGGTRALQSLGGWLTAPMRAITFLGDEKFYLLAMPLIYWCIHKGLGADFAVLLVISGFVNGCLKSFVKRSRPFWEAPELKLSSASSFSTPSGHAQMSAALFGYLAWFLAKGRRNVLWVMLLALLAGLVSLSRVYLGVHFPGDVLWGAAIGLMLAALYAALKPVLVPRLRQLALAEHLVMAPVTTAAMFAVMALLRSVPFGSSTRFTELYRQAMNATIEESAAVSGLALGLWIGLVVETRYVRFSVAGPAWQRALRYAIGVAVLAVIWFGLGAIIPAGPSLFGVARYALVMGWAVAGWPWLFVRLGLGIEEGS